jgi:hypothetical protein
MRISVALLFPQILVFANRVLGHLLHNSCVTPSLLVPILLALVFPLAQLGIKTVFIWLGD